MASELREIFITVSELNRVARVTLEKGLPSCRVQGEVSNFTQAGSGHWYFSLKDDQASVRCVMFKTRSQFVEWRPRDGDRVEIRAQPTLYEQRGDFQLQVEAMRQSGLGSVFEAFLRLKSRLAAEGLFSPDLKKPLPRVPRQIGVITSPQAAALRDVMATLRSRWPASKAILYPAQVQGESAPTSLVEAITLAGLRKECDVLLLVRGGGSLEDLAGFNDETVARAIAACPIPIISGVGHETDFTIADFVADLRAPTPTGAAQAATPSGQDILAQLRHLRARCFQAFSRKLNAESQSHDNLSRRIKHPRERIAARLHGLDHARLRLNIALRERVRIETARHERAKPMPPSIQVQHLRNLAASKLYGLQEFMRLSMTRRTSLWKTNLARLELLNPHAVLERGYSVVRNKRKEVIGDASALGVEEEIEITLARGAVEATVKKVIPS